MCAFPGTNAHLRTIQQCEFHSHSCWKKKLAPFSSLHLPQGDQPNLGPFSPVPSRLLLQSASPRKICMTSSFPSSSLRLRAFVPPAPRGGRSRGALVSEFTSRAAAGLPLLAARGSFKRSIATIDLTGIISSQHAMTDCFNHAWYSLRMTLPFVCRGGVHQAGEKKNLRLGCQILACADAGLPGCADGAFSRKADEL